MYNLVCETCVNHLIVDCLAVAGVIGIVWGIILSHEANKKERKLYG